MTDDQLPIAELEDRKGVVYLIGVHQDIPQSVADWLYSEDFERMWRDRFLHADFLLMPGDIDGVIQLEADDVEQVKQALGHDDTEEDHD